MQSATKTRHGFTVIELLVVVAVIAVLAAVAVLGFRGVRQRANESASATAVVAANKKLDIYKIANRFYPQTLTEAEVNAYSNTSYQYTTPDKLSYCLTATTNNVSMFGSDAVPQPARGGCVGHAVDGVLPANNYVLNPSFESGALNPNWLVAGGAGYTYSLSGVQKYKGTSSGSVTLTTGTAANSFFYTTATVPTAGTYYVTAWVYITNGANTYTDNTATGCSGNSFDARFYGGASTVSACYNRGTLGAWQKVSATVTAAAGAGLQLRFYPPVANGAVMYLDAVMVSSVASNYADGSTAGWAWSGAPNASSSSGTPQ